MKKLYTTKLKTYLKPIPLAVLFMVLLSFQGFSQVRVPFSPRESQYTPTKTIYNIKGDFTMMGNTNLTLVNYGVNEHNGYKDMQYVDVDNDANTINSSMAELKFSDENGASPECSNILYAGLYWTGRAGAATSFNVFNNNFIIGSSNLVTGTNYTMTVTRQGADGNYYPRYTFTSSESTVIFESLNTNYQVRYSINGGTSWIIASNQNLSIDAPDNDSVIVSFDPVTFGSGSNQIIVSALQRDEDIDEDLNNTVNHAYALLDGYTKTLNKRKISLKGPSATSYEEFTADTDNIYYPSNTDNNMYSGYTEVTDYVKTYGLGNYFVADMALQEGNGGDIGYYGGWGMVVVYENSKMKWRDVTIFDGHAFVTNLSTVNFEIPISGFNAVQNGDVNVKLGVMAGEGDNYYGGDYFNIRNAADDDWVPLSHSGNNSGNFFNSSIVTGNNNRNPNLINNTGLDISMFNINNTNNTIIDNNQTSTRFRYGSTIDTYAIFNLTFSVDAYVPETEGILTTTAVNTSGADPMTLFPGESAEYKIEIKNKGTEATNNTTITIPIPYTSSYENLSIDYNVNAPLVTSNQPYYDPNAGATGSIIWNIGTLPVSNNPEDILADISFKLKATTDCALLVNTNCTPNISLNGSISGIGDQSNTSFNQALIKGYETSGSCIGEPIPTPNIITIDSQAYVAANCGSYTPVRDFYFCNIGSTPIQTSQVNAAFSPGTRFYNEYPKTSTSIEYNTSNPFPPTLGTLVYYAIPPGTTTCYYEFTINVSNITSVPTVEDVIYCLNETATPLTATPSDAPTTPSVYNLYYYVDNNPSTPAQNSIVPSTSSIGETTYYVAEGYSNSCISQTRVPIKVTVSSGTPEITAPAVINIEACDENSITALTARYPFSTSQSADIKDTYITTGYTASEGETITSITYIDVITPGSSCPLVITRTFTITNGCGSTATAEQIINITDTTAPTGTAPTGVSGVDVCATNAQTVYPFNAATIAGNYTDNCADNVIANLTNASLTGDDCSWSLVYTYEVLDACGNKLENQTITHTGSDQSAPTGTAPIGETDADICSANAQTTYPFNATTIATNYSDNCGGTVTVNLTDTTQTGDDCSWSLVYTFEVVDACGNKLENQTMTHTGSDQSAPIIDNTSLDNIEIECGVGDTEKTLTDWLNANAGATASDNCSEVSWSNDYGSDTSVKCDDGAITVTFTATDVCGNKSSTTATYLIKDIIAPQINNTTGDLDTTLECSDIDAINDALALTPTATDDCSTPALNIVSDETNIDPTCPSAYVRVRIWNFVDACGNISENFTQTITVQDNTAPVLTLPANVSAECSDDLSPIAFGTATAIDNCDENPIITYVDERTDGTCSGTYSIKRTWKATDACGNTVTADQIISVSDTTAPEFVETTLPENIVVECDAIPTAVKLNATDNCGEAIVTFEESTQMGICVNNYIVTRTWTATDECGLTKTHIQTITVQDTTPPTFVETTLPPANLVVECDAVPTAIELNATDTCGSATVSVNDVRTNGNCLNNYTLTRTWTATDACKNTTKHTQIITVRDTKAPTFVGTLPINTVTVECDAVPVAEVLTATDNCGTAPVTVKDVITTGDCPNNYIITRTWTATDECGLTTIHTQIITVQDTKAPLPSTTFDEVLNVSCTNIPDAPALTFTDNCTSESNIIVVFNETSTFVDNVLNDYEIVRTWTVSDECGNDIVYKQTLFVALDEIITDIVAEDRCFDDGIVNLNDIISSSLNTNGTWELIEGNPAATLSGSIFNPTTLELSPDFLPQSGGIDYEFRYTTTDAGCVSITNVTMNINADCVVLPCGENDIVISKAVTPNGDAYNESFDITGIDLCGFTADVKIFNRWGALIFESNSYTVGENMGDWKGTASKKSIGASGTVPNGTYYYIVTLKDSGLAPFTGPVYLGTK
ncbi:gliding motility-associated C-terminal domain-containing protein [Mariniflexile litorale]|uniref:Gliding motility-associated C-terminal domain-containing protein n=1 Tax=Mariniflexile litorale TaxID=3045158 RepID=A0AAU7EF38_9FLAO|nr:gliding motility-associated C-terminal domain-containing protein [Mariniflexile sp. KMM 9835]MDQ8212386.1 gliding motility-associated C-terminal domain-containing protein [Mariniflexile sp. KMM 9835]